MRQLRWKTVCRSMRNWIWTWLRHSFCATRKRPCSITTDKKPFDTKKFCEALEIPRVSFAPQELFEEILGTKIGAATIYSVLDDWDKTIQVIFDQEVADSEYYGCSDGTTTGYMKVKTEDILTKILPHSRHKYKVIGI